MKWTFKLCLLFLILIKASIQADHSIFVLLTHPRATGTAFEKVMRQQQNLTIIHAPFLNPYLIKKYGNQHPFTIALPHPSLTFENVENQLFAIALNTSVFFKESGYLLLEYFKEHPQFYKNKQVKIAFLIRDPAKSILSFYRKMPTVDASIIGHEQLWELFRLLKDQLNEIPLVIDSDAFLKNPLPILNQLGTRWGLKFDENHLKWESGYADDWHLTDWYEEVAHSTQLGSYQGDLSREEDGTPKYLEVIDEKDRAKLQAIFRIQNVFYKKLLEYAIQAD